MYSQNEILANIKSVVQEEIPDAHLYLFGSRVSGNVHEESDWDILVLTEKKYPRNVRDILDKKLYDLSVLSNNVFSFIVATQKDWETHPGYYSLQLGIGNQYISL